MNMSVASTGQWPSQPPRTTRARRDSVGMRQPPGCQGEVLCTSGWSGRASGSEQVLDDQLVEECDAVPALACPVDVVLLEPAGVGPQLLPRLALREGRTREL